jgi:hypothetical protein
MQYLHLSKDKPVLKRQPRPLVGEDATQGLRSLVFSCKNRGNLVLGLKVFGAKTN